MTGLRLRSLGLLAAAGGALMASGCTSTLIPSPFQIQMYITRVTDATGTIQGVLRTGDAPPPNGGPSNTVSGFAAMVNGGSAQVNVTGSASFDHIIVAMAGATNYYELTVPAGTGRSIVLGASPALPNFTLPMRYSVGTTGVVGPYSSQNIRVIHVGTGDVQVSVAWSDSSDVDLHVVDPSGEEIYYGNTASASGGTLDLDSNASCSRDPDGTHKSNENVVWPTGTGPTGTYTVRLAYWSDCGVPGPTEYILTVARAGQTPLLFSGSFMPPGTGGGLGAGVLITTFTF